MKLSDFDFELPSKLIAQKPVSPRNHAKLLVYDRRTKAITDDHFYNLDTYLNPKTTVVLNNSKVEKCRFVFGKTEIFLVETVTPFLVKALVRPGKKFKLGTTTIIQLQDGQELRADTVAIDPEGIRTLKLSLPVDSELFKQYRLTPFPPYIRQDESIADEYQTVYAQPLGSKAAPTAGLHFTADQLASLQKKHSVAYVTLHVGLGTFMPVKHDDISKHSMHSENYIITSETAVTLNTSSHITAIGTTTTRVLESLSKPYCSRTGSTDIFINPGFQFKNVDSLVTNFHLPKSTLCMLVAAFIGSTDEWRRIYSYAIQQEYRFFSFGDAMLIL